MILRDVLIAIVMAAASAAAIQSAVIAQTLPSSSVAVIDLALILRDSKAGKGLQPQLAALDKEMKDAEKAASDSLRAKQKALGDQRALLAPDAFQQREEMLREEFNTARRDLTQRKEEANEMVQAARNKLMSAVHKITQELAKETSLVIVLPKQQVFVVNNAPDITSLAMARLDQQVPSVTLEKPKSAPKPKK